MTVKQFRKKVDVARKYGSAKLEDSNVLYYHGDGRGYSLEAKDGNVVDFSYYATDFEYLFED